MPDSALEATERQFLQILERASENIPITLVLYALPGIERNEIAANRIRDCYESTDSLSRQHLDGLIVTGREPIAPHLSAEPYWHAFTDLIQWAQEHTSSTIWSCLAAHAVLYHLDGIERVKSQTKHCGVFRCSRLSDHPLMADMSATFRIPHSRWNDSPVEPLARHGYRLLSHSEEGGVDIFCKELKSLFLFFQGHPEYEIESLMLEYRRDVGRYLRGESGAYPSMPVGYFDYSTRVALLALEKQALNDRRPELFSEVSAILNGTVLEKTWASTAHLLYRNWLSYLIAHKPQRDLPATVPQIQPAVVSQIGAHAATQSL